MRKPFLRAHATHCAGASMFVHVALKPLRLAFRSDVMRMYNSGPFDATASTRTIIDPCVSSGTGFWPPWRDANRWFSMPARIRASRE